MGESFKYWNRNGDPITIEVGKTIPDNRSLLPYWTAIRPDIWANMCRGKRPFQSWWQDMVSIVEACHLQTTLGLPGMIVAAYAEGLSPRRAMADNLDFQIVTLELTAKEPSVDEQRRAAAQATLDTLIAARERLTAHQPSRKA